MGGLKDNAQTYGLERLLGGIAGMRLHTTSNLRESLKKPLLLLLLLSLIERDTDRVNVFRFEEVRDQLDALIRKWGGRGRHTRPEQPFFHLASSPFWICRTQQRYPPGRTALVSDLLDSRSYGSFSSSAFRLLRGTANRARVATEIIERWWPQSVGDDLREDLGLPPTGLVKRRRDPRFTSAVLANYRFSCAFCGFHALLNERPTGVDAAHIRWHSARGPDDATNGLALCKMHHWAFDRGVLGLTRALNIQVASLFVEQRVGVEPLSVLCGRRLAVRPLSDRPALEHLAWHRRNVFAG